MRAEPERIAPAELDGRCEHTAVVMRDGVRLATDVYLPKGGIGPTPAVLIRLPYDKSGRYTFIPQIGEYFAANGFACVTQDVRGKYRSEGDREPFVHEAEDGWDTIQWIVEQGWSDGRVGTWGDSYYGFTQWALASLSHPAHLAMVPRVTGHRFGDMRPGGGLPTFTLLDWVVDAWAVPELIVANGVDHGLSPALESVHPSLSHGAELFRRYIAVSENPEPWVASVFPGGDPAESLRIPALHVGGWFDNLQYWQLDDWASAQRSPAAEHQYLRMWTNDHEDYRWREPGTALGPDFGEGRDALAEHLPGLLDETISFFDHYLRGGAGRWNAPAVRYEHARVGIRSSAEWPPRRVVPTELALDEHSLGDQAAAPGGIVSWVHDPEDPVPFPIDSEWDQNRLGLPDEQELHHREDVAIFTTRTLDQALDIVGRVEFTAKIEAPTARTHLIVRLCDVAPDGSARMILANGIDAPADGRTPVTLRLGDTAYRLPVGHRLRCAVSTSMAGQYPVHPGTDEDPWSAVERCGAEQRLLLDGARLSFTRDLG